MNLSKYSFLPTEEYVRVLGRTVMLDDCRLLCLSASGVEFEYTGSKLTVSFFGDSSVTPDENGDERWRDQARVAVIVDGRMHLDVSISKENQSFLVCGEEEVGKHVVRIIKLSEPRMSSVGLGEITILAENPAKPTAVPDKFIEFIGDSITCGYGVDTPDELYHFSTGTENVTRAYAFLTANKLGADFSMVSYSGHGLISGYTPDPEVPKLEELVQPYYEILAYSYNEFRGIAPQNYSWDFKRQPDVVVINLGTNDESYVNQTENKRAQYEDALVAFLSTVHDRNPKASIVIAYGLMGDYLFETQTKAVERFKTKSDFDRVFNYHIEPQNPEKNGYVADFHPSPISHSMAAEGLAAYLKSIM